MRRFVRNLFRDLRTTKRTQPARQAMRSTNLQLEGLGDRVMPSTTAGAIQIGSTLEVIVTQPNEKIELIGDAHPGQLDVFQVVGSKASELGHARIKSINKVTVSLTNSDVVIVNDSNGYPFAGGTTITLSGTGVGNSLTLAGSRTLSAGEIYVGGDDLGEGSFLLLNTTYNLDSTITSVADSIKDTGRFDVQTSSGNVFLTGGNGVTQTMSDLGISGSAVNTLTYSNKSTVQLEEYAANANLTLDATAGDAGEKTFTHLSIGAGDVTNIETTPAAVATKVIVSGSGSSVNLEANSSPVSISGNSSTTVDMGMTVFSGDLLTTVTSGIKANVSVGNVGLLKVDDHGNQTKQENVKVTESTISGTGMFGNNAAVVNYNNLGKLQILAGEFGEKYAVSGSTPTAAFNTPIEIDGSADGSLSVSADMDSETNLDLVLKNASKADNSATLVFFAPGAEISPTKNPLSPNGAPDLTGGAEATFLVNGGHSIVEFTDFSVVLLDNHIPVE